MVSNLHFIYFPIGILDIICEFYVCICYKLARELSRELPRARSPSFSWFRHIPSNYVSPHSLFTSDLGLNFEHTDYAFLFYRATLNFVHVTSNRSSYSPFTCTRIRISVPAAFVPYQSNCILAQNATYP